jgi:tetratricopeptide (TPR) repeat protein
MKADRFWRFALKRCSLLALGAVTGALILSLFVFSGETAAQYRRPGARTPATAPRPTAPRDTNEPTLAPAEPAARGRNDVTQMPTVPMPTLARPNATARSSVVTGEPQQTEVIVEGDADKLPLAHEVNAGNVLVKEAFTKSESAKTEGDYSEIIALCEEGIKSGATKENAAYARRLAAWSYNRRGERFAELGNEEEALKDFTNAISHDPSHWRAMHNRGVSYATLAKPNEALADFSRALQLNRQYANTWFNRGEIYTDRGDYQRAIADYAEAIRLAPRESEFYHARGKAYSRIGRGREGLEDLNAAIRLDADNAEARVIRGEIMLASRNWSQAATDFRDAVKIDDKLGSAYRGAAWIMATCPDERFRNPEAAMTAAQKAMELDGDKDPRYIDTLAAAYAANAQYDSAVAILEAHLEKIPRNWQPTIQARVALYKAQQPLRDGTTPQQQMQQVQQQRAKEQQWLRQQQQQQSQQYGRPPQQQQQRFRQQQPQQSQQYGRPPQQATRPYSPR